MWLTWLKATKYSKLPSEIFDPRGQYGDLERFCLDNAVTYFGMTIEGATSQMVEVGSGTGKRWAHKWKLAQLLEDSFQFPREEHLSMFKQVEGYEEVDG